MTLDRNTVGKTARRHIAQLQQGGAKLSPKAKRELRKLHERIAAKVARRARNR